MIEAIGFLAAAITTSSFFPQLIKTWKTKETESLSLVMLIALVVGLTLWLIYGILTKSAPIIAANGVSVLLIGIVLILKIRYG